MLKNLNRRQSNKKRMALSPSLRSTSGQLLLDERDLEDGGRLMAKRYLMCCLVYKNAQRQGAVVNLRVAVVERAVCHSTKSGDDVYVYKVCVTNDYN